MTKYNTSTSYGENPDKIATLDPEDDAARANMGGDWRMPTRTEIQELLNNTTTEWFDNFNGTGRKGYKFISKADTSKYIFIPAAGCSSNGSVYNVGYYGYVWSSSLDAEDNGCAWDLHFDSDNISGIYYNFYRNRYRGYAVRGVMD